MTHIGMTKRQHETLIFIEAYVDRFGYSPSYQDIANHLCLKSKSGVHRIVHALHERGLIAMVEDRARTLVSTRQAA